MRLIAVGIIHNKSGEILICKKPPGRGVFPGQWGLPGGGLETRETVFAALQREIKEEAGLEVTDIQPLFFSDGTYQKSFTDGSQQEIYMVFLLFSCLASSDAVTLNSEFEEYRWVKPEELNDYDLNLETARTFARLGLIASTGGRAD
jgi:nucleoside triphosphatase